MQNIVESSKKDLIEHLWEVDPAIKIILKKSDSSREAREKIFEYLNRLDRHYTSIYADNYFKELHTIEKTNARECIKILKNVIRTENERTTHFSALRALIDLAKNKKDAVNHVQAGFVCEFINLFKGINGKSDKTDDVFILPSDSTEASIVRSEKLDSYAKKMNEYLSRHKSGLEPELIVKQKALKKKILDYFQASETDWKTYQWHLTHVIREKHSLSSLISLENDELEGLQVAEQNQIPFEITPYYLSLFNETGRTRDDQGIRAQVLPSKTYCTNVIDNRKKHIDMDFMGEKSTNPVEGITRRYPQIVILKPVNVCPQICVYCQRNWELEPSTQVKTKDEDINNAIEWINQNKYINEVLVTGGDPFILPDDYLDKMLAKLASIDHVERIRIGTRTLVTLPCRITEALVDILHQYHEIGKREICIVTHFEHVAEITPEVLECIKKIRNRGISIYNQQVFTYYTSLKYQTAALRKILKISGIDPYYTFNTKGKEETIDFRVPIARIQQERKEEARFLPGLVRTDEPVFNVPKLGKSHLRAWQDHEIIMILASGQRVYRFYPWESSVTLVDAYLYTDVSIYDYLKRLANDGQDLDEYKTIWYYF
ncbi:MAG: KamA family radical SAM protein [Thermoplasmata archaeon M9B2D]|nr:MAG: KamA family radical SAM protein [Thermoplasmata archaeon M9B2D]